MLVFASACENKIEEAMEGEGRKLLPVQTTYNAVITYSSNGHVTTRLKAPIMERYSTQDSTWLLMKNGFETFFYDSSGVFQSKLKGNFGIWYERSRYILGDKGIVFENTKNETLHTKSLIWMQDSAKIYTSDPLKILRNDGVIYGQGLVAAEDFSAYTIQKITGELYVNEDTTQTNLNYEN